MRPGDVDFTHLTVPGPNASKGLREQSVVAVACLSHRSWRDRANNSFRPSGTTSVSSNGGTLNLGDPTVRCSE